MTSNRWLVLCGVGMLLVACGGGVSLGNTDQGLGKDGGTDGGDNTCQPSDCANSVFACANGQPTNLRCVRGAPGGSAGPLGICSTVGDCPGSTDPCQGKTFPTCPRECTKFPETGACSTGDACRLQGSTIGDECTCTAGAWQCTPHAPLGMGCNKVCEPGKPALVCPMLGGTYDKTCNTVADCTTVARGCYCGSQPVLGIAKSGATDAQTCETKNASSCALGCPNGPGQVAEDGKSDQDGGTIKVLCDLNKCHTVVQ